MIPTIFPLINGTVAQLGANPCRFYPHGQAPQGITLPYATYQIIAATPENYLNEAPDIDNTLIQVDVWASSALSASQTADAIRDALESHAHMTGFGGTARDPDTQHYRYRMDFSFWIPR